MRGFALACFFALIAGTPTAILAQTNTAAPAAHKPAAARPAGTTQTRTKMTTDPALLKPASLTAKAPDTYEVKLATTKGDIVVQVNRAWAPLGADRFYNLVRHGFYNDAAFFRIVPGFVVQFGLSGDPAVNRAWKKCEHQGRSRKREQSPRDFDFRHGRPEYAHHAAIYQFGE